MIMRSFKPSDVPAVATPDDRAADMDDDPPFAEHAAITTSARMDTARVIRCDTETDSSNDNARRAVNDLTRHRPSDSILEPHRHDEQTVSDNDQLDGGTWL
jgi:hypothetical protein